VAGAGAQVPLESGIFPSADCSLEDPEQAANTRLIATAPARSQDVLGTRLGLLTIGD